MCHVAAKYHVTAMTKSWPPLAAVGWQWLAIHVRIHYNFFRGEIDEPITGAHFYDSIRIGRSIVIRLIIG